MKKFTAKDNIMVCSHLWWPQGQGDHQRPRRPPRAAAWPRQTGPGGRPVSGLGSSDQSRNTEISVWMSRSLGHAASQDDCVADVNANAVPGNHIGKVQSSGTGEWKVKGWNLAFWRPQSEFHNMLFVSFLSISFHMDLWISGPSW